MNAFEAAAQNNRAEELRNELVELFASQNQSGDSNFLSIPATYLKVTVKCS